MKTIQLLFISFFVLISLSSHAENSDKIRSSKVVYDISQSEFSNLKSESLSSNRKKVTTKLNSYTLMQGGYFTIGTSTGISESIIDDYCQISFGHPYALTSYPFIKIDGSPIYPTFYGANQEITVEQNGDTLSVESQYQNNISGLTKIYSDANGSMVLSFAITNLDELNHQVEPALLFDVALGKWGDGHVFQNQEFLTHSNSMQQTGANFTEIWERNSSPKGVGVKLTYNNQPAYTKYGNWNTILNEQEITELIYDLAVLNYWEKITLQPNESTMFTVTFELINPDYNNELFMRCDMPNAMQIENSQLYPGKLNTLVEIINNNQKFNDLKIHVEATDYTKEWISETAINTETEEPFLYEKALINIPEIFEDRTLAVTLNLMNGTQLLDQLSRQVFIPSSPFSDQGLTVEIDSNFNSYGKSYFRFTCTNDLTQQFVYNLGKNNIFFYEDDNRLEDFKLKKDTTGGINNADIVFVLDVTGSMSNEIAGVRDNIIEFADSMSFQGIDFQIGMVTFLDVIENIYPFTSDVQSFQSIVAEQFAHGGADRPENSLDALMDATQFNFRPDANRVVIWITDADYHITDNITGLSINDVSNSLIANGIKVFCIGSQSFQTDYYDPIVMNTGGSYFDINGNFRDILLEVSRMEQSSKYLLEYPTTAAGQTFKIEVHYAGLGGFDTFTLNKGKATEQSSLNAFAYPNPVQNNTLIEITGENQLTYEIEVFNNYGRQVGYQKISLANGTNTIPLSEILKVSSLKNDKLYVLRVKAIDSKGSIKDHQILKLQSLQ